MKTPLYNVALPICKVMQTIIIGFCFQEEVTILYHLRKGTIIRRDCGLGIGYPSLVKYLKAI